METASRVGMVKALPLRPREAVHAGENCDSGPGVPQASGTTKGGALTATPVALHLTIKWDRSDKVARVSLNSVANSCESRKNVA
jgi:hypothetical protein